MANYVDPQFTLTLEHIDLPAKTGGGWWVVLYGFLGPGKSALFHCRITEEQAKDTVTPWYKRRWQFTRATLPDVRPATKISSKAVTQKYWDTMTNCCTGS